MGDRPGPDAPGVTGGDTLPMRNPKIAARVINGETMVLTPHDSVLHTLNPVATRVWQLMPDHMTYASLAEALASEYEVDPATAEQDVRELVAAMLERQILVQG